MQLGQLGPTPLRTFHSKWTPRASTFGGSQKGGFGGCSSVPQTGTRVHSDVPRTKNQKEGPKIGTRAHSPKPPFYETALLFPLEPLSFALRPIAHCRDHSWEAQLWTCNFWMILCRGRKIHPKPRNAGCNFFTYNWKLRAYNWALLLVVALFSFFTYNNSWSFFAYSWSSSAYSGKVCLRSNGL